MPKVRRTKIRATRRTKAQRCAAPRQVASTSIDVRGESGHSGGPRSDLATRLIEQFRKICCGHVAAHPECEKDASSMKKYMRNQFEFFGLKAPALKILEKEMIESNKLALQDRGALMGVFGSLWEEEEREFQHFGCTLLERHRKLLLGTSDEDFHEAMETVKRCICTKSWWDTVDMLASHSKKIQSPEAHKHVYVLIMHGTVNLCSGGIPSSGETKPRRASNAAVDK